MTEHSVNDSWECKSHWDGRECSVPTGCSTGRRYAAEKWAAADGLERILGVEKLRVGFEAEMSSFALADGQSAVVVKCDQVVWF